MAGKGGASAGGAGSKKANKNQTAALRAEMNRVFSGHNCSKTDCGGPINRDELRMVKNIEFTGAGKVTLMKPYHIKCYAMA
jgi:hypothetical protein